MEATVANIESKKANLEKETKKLQNRKNKSLEFDTTIKKTVPSSHLNKFTMCQI